MDEYVHVQTVEGSIKVRAAERSAEVPAAIIELAYDIQHTVYSGGSRRG